MFSVHLIKTKLNKFFNQRSSPSLWHYCSCSPGVPPRLNWLLMVLISMVHCGSFMAVCGNRFIFTYLQRVQELNRTSQGRGSAVFRLHSNGCASDETICSS